MEKGQQLSTQVSETLEADVVPIPFSQLPLPQQSWVDYNVVQGVVTEADGTMTKMTVGDFARQVGVDRTTLYNWSKAIPNFWDLVAERRKLLFAGARTAKVWNSVFLAATVKLNTTAQQMWLANADPSFKMPNAKLEVDIGGGLADVVNRARAIEEANKKQNVVIEGEVVDGTEQANNG